MGKKMVPFGKYIVLDYEASEEEIEAAKQALMEEMQEICRKEFKGPAEKYKKNMRLIEKKIEGRWLPAKFVYGDELPEGVKPNDMVFDEPKRTVAYRIDVPVEDLIHPEIAE